MGPIYKRNREEVRMDTPGELEECVSSVAVQSKSESSVPDGESQRAPERPRRASGRGFSLHVVVWDSTEPALYPRCAEGNPAMQVHWGFMCCPRCVVQIKQRN